MRYDGGWLSPEGSVGYATHTVGNIRGGLATGVGPSKVIRHALATAMGRAVSWPTISRLVQCVLVDCVLVGITSC